ncbi:MAG: hypothetical protein R3C10_19425 [Pirellulales bacterium]|nr:hypothetical protein [Planctomycetales bacterium]
MAARESQGLQITLGVMFVITLLLCVATYFLFTGYRTQRDRAEQLASDNQDLQQSTRTAVDENSEFRRILGFEDGAELSVIKAAFEGQVRDVPPQNRSYRQALTYMDNLLHDLVDRRSQWETEMASLRDRLAQAEAAKTAQNDAYLAAQQAAEKDRDNQTQQFQTDRSKLESEKSELDQQLAMMRTTVEQETEKAKAVQDDAKNQVTEIDNLNKNLKDELEKLKSETFEVAAGEVYRVNQGQGVVWVNLGSSDSLRRQVTFSVYSSDPNDVARRAAKAKIEVTRILGPHLAEARILEDTYADPITPGDLINSSAWSPGRARHFALAGFMDIDGDSTDDRQLVRDIIAINGGVIDAELNDEGKIEGKVTIDTDYIIVGAEKEGALIGVSEIQSRARELGVDVITVDRFLDLAGWKDKTNVLRFGVGESAGASRNKPEEGTFQFRSPPRNRLPDAKYAKPESR